MNRVSLARMQRFLRRPRPSLNHAFISAWQLFRHTQDAWREHLGPQAPAKVRR